MNNPRNLLLALAATVGAYTLLWAGRSLIRSLRSPLRKLVRPENPSLIFGNFKETEADALMTHLEPVYRGPDAIEHIAKHVEVYQRETVARGEMNTLAGQGGYYGFLAFKERTIGVREQSWRAMPAEECDAPLFALINAELTSWTPMKLRDIWARPLEKNSRLTHMDILPWLRFDYQFDSLEGKQKGVHEVFHKLFNTPPTIRQNTFRILQSRFPLLKLLTPRLPLTLRGGLKSVSRRRDLFSLLLSTNLDEDVPAHHRMKDVGVIDRFPYIQMHLAWSYHLHEKFRNWVGVTCTLHQPRRANETAQRTIYSLSTDNPTMDDLNLLPYLDKVAKETLRVYPPVAFLTRIAVMMSCRSELPVSIPKDAHIIICCTPQAHTAAAVAHGFSSRILKGEMVHVAIWDVNMDTSLWGDDGDEWRIGPHDSRGVVEPAEFLGRQKALLFVLIRAFELERAVPDGHIQRFSSVLSSPFVKGEREKGTQMPLIVKAYLP
ncbi:hypothetical protein DFH07DRAFT_765646 [Mycena maculata]|uniref:Cytochrome P450 n=1 Tax=Mycena maculata TaxID=230809 RepID=A0AAD7K6S7_9AGAR|nr:hypothetical protein DFH07DRAFT_765646 [Mycena maculata]